MAHRTSHATPDIEEFNRLQGYTPSEKDGDKRILERMRALDDFCLGRFKDVYADYDPKAEEAAHQDSLNTARRQREEREAFLQLARDWPNQQQRLQAQQVQNFLSTSTP